MNRMISTLRQLVEQWVEDNISDACAIVETRMYLMLRHMPEDSKDYARYEKVIAALREFRFSENA